MTNEGSGWIALVDDERAVRESLQFRLALEGYTVRAYASAKAFLDDREVAQPSCLILDQNMPQMTGLELAAKLRAEGDALPILLVTAQPVPAVVASANDLGIEKVLEKPPDDESLLIFIRAHANRSALCR